MNRSVYLLFLEFFGNTCSYGIPFFCTWHKTAPPCGNVTLHYMYTCIENINIRDPFIMRTFVPSLSLPWWFHLWDLSPDGSGIVWWLPSHSLVSRLRTLSFPSYCAAFPWHCCAASRCSPRCWSWAACAWGRAWAGRRTGSGTWRRCSGGS